VLSGFAEEAVIKTVMKLELQAGMNSEELSKSTISNQKMLSPRRLLVHVKL